MRRNFLMIGHSNMCDRGTTSQLPAFVNAANMFVYRETDNWLAQVGNPSPPPFILNNPGYWTQAVDVVEPAGSTAGQCGALQLAFADKMAGYLGCEIGLVPHALGGSALDGWIEWHRQTGLFGMALQRARWAEAQGTLSGIVCWLGENDCASTTVASAISQKYGNFLMAMRCALGNLNLPIVIVKPGDENYKALPGWAEMRKQIDWMTLGNFAVVNTDDITPNAGDVHFNTAAYLQIGNRIADTLFPLL